MRLKLIIFCFTRLKRAKSKEQRAQRHLCDRVIEILALDDQSSCWLPDLEANKDLQTKLLGLIPDIRTYFLYKSIPGADNPAATMFKCLKETLAISCTGSHQAFLRLEEDRGTKKQEEVDQVFINAERFQCSPE